jgi:phosphatidate cytidylyltransferase
MLKTRILTVLVLLPLFVAALFYFPIAAWALFLAPLLLIGAWEWGALAGWHRAGRAAYTGVIAICGVLLWQFGYGNTESARTVTAVVLAVSLLFWLVAAPLWLKNAWRVRQPLILAVAGAILLLPLAFALVYLHRQPAVLLMLMAIVWISDTAAYACGRLWGRRKLAVTISPGKTWEGAFGALAAVALYYLLIRAGGWAAPPLLQGATGFSVFMLLTLLGIEGDLFESWIKRVAGAKDSGAIIPGHGGVLDRIDALTASIPAAALFLSATT